MSTVLVTGGSGFIGGHVILQLLAAGHAVRTTVRNPDREADIRSTLQIAGLDHETLERLSVVVADLEKDAGWTQAAAGCEFVHHVASPFPLSNPRDAETLIRPAVDGTLRVLRAARDGGAKRTVVTSSFAAIGYGHRDRPTPFDETDWTDLTSPDARPYIQSKTLAERAAWDFIARENSSMELAVVNPVGVFGPALNSDLSSSVGIIKAMLNGDMPQLPRIWFGVVDVRDVADLHLRCMSDPKAKGERFLAVAGPSMSLLQAAQALHARLGAVAARVPTRETPDLVIRLAALFNKRAREVVPSLGRKRQASSAKAKRLLGWSPRSNEEAVVASAESLIALGAVKAAA